MRQDGNPQVPDASATLVEKSSGETSDTEIGLLYDTKMNVSVNHDVVDDVDGAIRRRQTVDVGSKKGLAGSP